MYPRGKKKKKKKKENKQETKNEIEDNQHTNNYIKYKWSKCINSKTDISRVDS